ncbi:MAG TPA: uroporphyrinogen-III C-methyltransferase [Acidimicrobiales bacterium]|nr:uroporphyrinogen-III C-methyltransferase [Acidimicrobiales bacterium]
MSVYIVGAGPGAPDLLTVRARDVLERADVVVHDRLVDERVLALAPSAQLVSVGKAPGHGPSQESINQILCELAQRHSCIVRLKGGDPFVFGRGAEELRALSAAGVEVEVVPGISSAFAAPLAAGISVTERAVARGVTVVTGRASDGDVDFRALANAELTLVILMGVERRGQIADQLVLGGLSPTTPVAIVERVSWCDQRVRRCRLDELAATPVRSPAVIVVGSVADDTSWIDVRGVGE